jgi:hypothetical protein
MQRRSPLDRAVEKQFPRISEQHAALAKSSLTCGDRLVVATRSVGGQFDGSNERPVGDWSVLTRERCSLLVVDGDVALVKWCKRSWSPYSNAITDSMPSRLAIINATIARLANP